MTTAITVLVMCGAIAFGLFLLRKQPTGKGLHVKVEPGATPETDLDSLYEKYAARQGLDPMLLKAIARVESNENPKARNPADPSIGLMQVLCIPDGRGGCSNKLNVLDWPPESEGKLFDPDYNLHIASQILSWNTLTFGTLKGIAVYNSWGARNDPPDGPFRNQDYVDKVRREYVTLTDQSIT